MSKSINKEKIITNLRNHKIDDFSEQMINGKIIYNIILGDKMTKVSKIDLILQEMRQGFNQVNTRLDRVEDRLDRVEHRLDKVEARLDKVEDRLDNLEKNVSILKKDVSQLKIDVDQIKQCPTIKKELNNL